MTTQEIIVAAVVLLSVAFLFFRAIRSLRAPDGSCSSGCGCGVGLRKSHPPVAGTTDDHLGRRIDLIQVNTGAKPPGERH